MWRLCRDALYSFCCVLACFSAGSDSQARMRLDRLDLTGTVVAEGDSTPIKRATVFVYTAAVRRGTSPFCPSCYPDCQKSATTDKHGRFRIEALDPELVFRVLVVAENHQPRFVSKVDPTAGPMQVDLARLDHERLAPGHFLRGKVIDQKGKAVVGAEIVPYSMKTDQGTRYGDLQGVDPVAVTNRRGEFVITSNTPDAVVSVKVRARNQATLKRRELAFGDVEHEIRLDAGVSVSGQVLHAGKPVAGVEVGLAQTSRGSDTFVGPYTIGTNQDGFFAFVNVKPDDEYYLYGIMASLQPLGGVPARKIRVAGAGSRTHLTPLQVEPAQRLAGRIVLSDGGVLPAGTRLLVSRADAWDSKVQEIESDGRFEVTGLPTGPYQVGLSVEGYFLSLTNRSLDLMNQLSLVGHVDHDIEDLVIELQPGVMPPVDREAQLKANPRMLRDQPLRGAEPEE